VGTIFGGSLFSAGDPFYMLMLLRVLGKQYVVWDKSASIQFRKPGRQTLYARLELIAEQIEHIRQEVLANGKMEQTFTLQWVGANGVVHAQIERLCYIADRQFYEQRKNDRQQSRLYK
jgi:hypothetical protein